MMNSEIEAFPYEISGCINTKSRIICNNCKFNQKDYWNTDDILFSKY